MNANEVIANRWAPAAPPPALCASLCSPLALSPWRVPRCGRHPCLPCPAAVPWSCSPRPPRLPTPPSGRPAPACSAIQLLGGKLGDKSVVHPNDHVNKASPAAAAELPAEPHGVMGSPAAASPAPLQLQQVLSGQRPATGRRGDRPLCPAPSLQGQSSNDTFPTVMHIAGVTGESHAPCGLQPLRTGATVRGAGRVHLFRRPGWASARLRPPAAAALRRRNLRAAAAGAEAPARRAGCQGQGVCAHHQDWAHPHPGRHPAHPGAGVLRLRHPGAGGGLGWGRGAAVGAGQHRIPTRDDVFGVPRN